MALELKQEVRMDLRLVMTPQLQLSIKLLQQSRLELEDTIREELEQNPILEEQAVKDDRQIDRDNKTEESKDETLYEDLPRTVEINFDGDDKVQNRDPSTEISFEGEGNLEKWEAYIASTEAPTRTFEAPDPEDEGFEARMVRMPTLDEHLRWQLSASEFSALEQRVAQEIIGNLDEDGYFRTPMGEFIDGLIEHMDAAQAAEVDEALVESVLARLQQLDPPGICARNVQECLLLQLENLELDETYVAAIVREHIEDLERRNYNPIMKALNIDKERMSEALEVLGRLNPRPAGAFTELNNRYVVPDVFVHKIGDDYVISLNNDGIPNLGISSYYRSRLKRGAATSEEDKKYINDKLNSARWLIKSIQQRQRTIYRVTESIIKFQRDFLDRGIEYLKPLVLHDVANDLELHESTVSRVTTNKYVQTPQGILELKFFFNSSVSSLYGDDVSSLTVKEKIKQMIAKEQEEHPEKPLSDTKIADLLKKQNIDIARRTVAKYREQLGIPPSSKRRKVL